MLHGAGHILEIVDDGDKAIFIAPATLQQPGPNKQQAEDAHAHRQDVQFFLQFQAAEEKDEQAQIVVLASGNLGLIYGTRLGRRVMLEEIEEVYPGLLEGLASHEGVGFVMVRSEAHGPVVVGAGGRCYLAEDRVEGENPLDGFGPNAAQHLRRADSFPDAPDILVNSFCSHQTNEVAAFEELIGSHGGLGGYQTQPFVLYPAQLPVGDGPLVGAAAVYRLLKEWASHTNGKETTPRQS